MHRTISQLPRRPREGNSARRLAVVRAIRTTGTLLGDTRAKLALGLHRKTEGSVAASQYKPAIPNPVLDVSQVTGSGTAARQHQHPLSMQPLKGFRDIADEQQTKGHIDGAAVRMGTRVVLVLEVRRGSVEEARNEVAEIKGRGIAPSVIGWLGE